MASEQYPGAHSPSSAPSVWRRAGLDSQSLATLGLLTAAAAVVLACHLVNELAGFNTKLFNLDEEENLPTWLSSVQFCGVAVLAALAGLGSTGRLRLAWAALAGIFLFFSLDEVALVHEKLSKHVDLGAESWRTPVLYSPLLVALLLAVWLTVRDVRRALGTAVPFLAGFALVAGALLIDAADIQTFDVESPRLRPFIVLEEAFELLGTAVILTTVLAVLLQRSRAVRPA